jgi:hypothetical protein
MTKALLMSVLVVPALIGVMAARRRGLRGLPQAIVAFAVFAVLYMLFLQVQHYRWL